MGLDRMRNAITWVDETDITDRLLGESDITSVMIQQMAAYLARKRGDRLMPSRADIDPTEIRAFLPYVVLVDIHSDPLRVYYRLVGTRIAEFYGEFTGTWMHDRPISDAYRQIAENIYRTLIETKAPVYGITEMRTRTDAMVSYEWGYFPLSNDGINVTGGLEIESPDRRVVGVAPALADSFVRRS
ncbi:MAG: PAS domain-containing protein [Dongiaceae bacterium]